MLDKPWSKHPEYVALWIYCLMRGNYTETDIITRTGTHVHLMPGQFIASREQISLNTGIQESKVERILKVFKSEQQIEQQNCGKFRIISILNWDKFQAREQQNEQQVNNRRTTGEQQVNTDNKVKKEKKEKKEPSPLPANPDHKLFITWFCHAHKISKGYDYVFEQGKDGKIVADLLKIVPDFRKLIIKACHFFLNDKKPTHSISFFRFDIGSLDDRYEDIIDKCRQTELLPMQGIQIKNWIGGLTNEKNSK